MVLNLGAVILPWIELVTGLFLIIGFKSRTSVIVIGLLLIMFDIMILINMYRGAPITCGCYDAVGEPIGWKKILENALMLVFSVQIYYFDRPELFKQIEIHHWRGEPNYPRRIVTVHDMRIKIRTSGLFPVASLLPDFRRHGRLRSKAAHVGTYIAEIKDSRITMKPLWN